MFRWSIGDSNPALDVSRWALRQSTPHMPLASLFDEVETDPIGKRKLGSSFNWPVIHYSTKGVRGPKLKSSTDRNPFNDMTKISLLIDYPRCIEITST